MDKFISCVNSALQAIGEAERANDAQQQLIQLQIIVRKLLMVLKFFLLIDPYCKVDLIH